MKIEIVKAVAEKYRKAIETGEVPEQLSCGICCALSFELFSLGDETDAYNWVSEILGFNYIAIYYRDLPDTEITLVPRLKWLEEQIERMENVHAQQLT
jgi:hypothetical protein